MEQYYTLSTPDSFEIKWILNTKEKSQKLLVFVHGFTGSMNEAHYYAAKEFFITRWYDVFRFNLYTDGEKTRKLRDCSVAIHTQDIQTVIEYFQGYQEIYLVGHSLGAPCIAWVSDFPKNVKKIVFWDGAFQMIENANKWILEGEYYTIQSSGKHLEVSKEMYREFMQNNFLDILKDNLFQKKDMFVIYADGARHIENKKIIDKIWISSDIIVWANHGFTQEGKYQELFEKTLEFIEA